MRVVGVRENKELWTQIVSQTYHEIDVIEMKKRIARG